ncbi:MAG: beta-lactamase family protein [Bryobacteraceae bacterium]|nr:beta-lactamase family protein [Bryobacteraceae bacterium]
MTPVLRFVAVPVLWAGTLLSQTPAPPAGAREFVLDLQNRTKAPGMSVAVMRDGKLVWTGAFGHANLETKTPVEPATLFRLGSVSKLYTAAIAARLADKGKLDWNAPVHKYIADYPSQKPFSILQLAGHLAGIRHYAGTDPVFKRGYGATLKEGLAIFKSDPLLSEPGAKYNYTSYGYNLLGAVLEQAGGADFLTLLRNNVTAPLGVQSPQGDDWQKVIEGRTGFYAQTRDQKIVNADFVDNGYKWPSGGLVASAADVAKFADAHLRPGFLKAETLEVMMRSQKLASGEETGVGIGWRSGKDPKGRRVLHHGGTIDGGRAMVMVYPGEKLVVVMLANLLARFGEAEAQQLAGFFLDKPVAQTTAPVH